MLGLTLAGASAVSHDLYASVFRRGRVNEQQEIRVSKMATVALGILAIILGIAFEQQNIAFMVGLAFAIAASANFPIIVLSMFWSKLTTRGALIGGFMGLTNYRDGYPRADRMESVLGNPKGSAPFPDLQPGDLLGDAGLLRLLAVLGPGQERERSRRGACLRSAVHPLPDRQSRAEGASAH